MVNFSDLTRCSAQMGSNPGGQFVDKTDSTKVYYIKFSKTNDHARNEVLACRLYQLAGAPVVNCDLIDLGNGKLGTVSVWQNVDRKFDPNNPEDIKAAQKWFGVHAWLGNWDAIGLEYDNQVWIEGVLTTVDVGGSLIYRAMGGRKTPEQFGPEVLEITSMRFNDCPSGVVFGSMTHADICESVPFLAQIGGGKLSEVILSPAVDGHEMDVSPYETLFERKIYLLDYVGY